MSIKGNVTANRFIPCLDTLFLPFMMNVPIRKNGHFRPEFNPPLTFFRILPGYELARKYRNFCLPTKNDTPRKGFAFLT